MIRKRTLQAPVLSVALFAAYLLALLVHGVLNFRDCPEEAEALRKVGMTESSVQMAAFYAPNLKTRRVCISTGMSPSEGLNSVAGASGRQERPGCTWDPCSRKSMTALHTLTAAIISLAEEVHAICDLPKAEQKRKEAAILAVHQRFLDLEPEMQEVAENAAGEGPERMIFGRLATQTVSLVAEILLNCSKAVLTQL